MSEEQMNDSTFNRLFIIMILAMTVLTVIIMVLASFASSDVNAKLKEQSEQENTQKVAERLAPIGVFSATTVAAVEPVVAADLTGAAAYEPCAACHISGAAGAPIVGDTAVWAERLKKGTETLYSNAINGINAMPAKGGFANLSDNTVKAAVDYMLEQSK
ncbi:MAG: c-type cytochrome [Gammaproteobacteria bacterium]|nr:c-type cytochrome [Gammaproteobacteria bacterium]